MYWWTFLVTDVMINHNS